jgi:3-oxoacyl-[acyl-carrier-protein] synthase III
MKISSIAARFPSRRVANSDLLQELADHNRSLPQHEVERYSATIKSMLDRAGAVYRFYRDPKQGETAEALLHAAVVEALEDAGIADSEIDLLIYCGVGRGFLEPGMAYFVASALGISCECFDVLDACMSWVRALYIAHNLFRSGRYRYILLVNAEFNVYERGYPELLKICSPSQWRYTFPAFTIGEAATATLLSKSRQLWNFHFRSQPKYSHLCTLPLIGHDSYVSGNKGNLAINGLGNFVCLGTELVGRANREMVDFVKVTYEDPQRFAMWFPHLATATPYIRAAEKLGLAEKTYVDTFPRYGNLVSASIPVALLTAARERKLKRGDHIVLCPISAGMSLALVDFTY